MRMSHYYMPTLREVPAEAEIPSHQLLLRSGMIRKAASGIYTFLPLGQRVLRKVEAIVREEMDAAGALEIRMSALQPREIWETSGRWATFGPEMFRLSDRNDRQFCLGPTAEEYFTALIRNELKSYKQLPLNLYQIQWKYRDEKRPRFGINRSREFLMKDAYTFDTDREGLEAAYGIMWDAYAKAFDRMGLNYRIVQGDSGAMGGNKSHEFTALSEVGEGVIVYSESGDYAATDEKAAVILPKWPQEALKPLERIETPGAKTIEELVERFGLDARRLIKAVDLRVADEPVIVLIPGDRELNMAKLVAFLGVPEHEIQMLDEATIRRLTGAEPGFTGPVGLSGRVRLIADKVLSERQNLMCGANETGCHLSGVNFGRDFEAEICEDLLMVQPGDIAPDGSELRFARGIEVGNIFQLGTKYSESLGAKYLDENGKEQPFYMGSYGIGITRCISAVVEQRHDERGIIWPTSVAPFEVIVTVVQVRDEAQAGLGEEIYAALKRAGIDAILDDRRERAGVKFNDRDLIGIPHRITVGKAAVERRVEYSTRAEMNNDEYEVDFIVAHIIDRVREERSFAR